MVAEEVVDEPERLVDAEPAVVDPLTLPERFPVVPAAPGVPADALVNTKSDPLLRSMHPANVIGALIEPVVVCVPGREDVSVCAPAVDDPGCCAEVEPGFCVPLCTGDCVGVCTGACADAATAIDNSAAIDDEAITRFLICSSG